MGHITNGAESCGGSVIDMIFGECFIEPNTTKVEASGAMRQM
jgi:hypothetical protein